MRTVLVTGTTGFLGSSLAASLLYRGHRVVSLLDRQIGETIAWNREFASTTFNFSTEKLSAAVGPTYCAQPMTSAQYLRGVDYFVRRLADQARFAATAAVASAGA